jgi:hypothetical protein
MFTSLPGLAIFIMFFWVALLGYYLYLSRQQKGLRDQMDRVRALLQENEPDQR